MTLEGHFPIRTLAALTGVKSATLRAWEARYGLLKPVRSQAGYRLFTQRDVDRVRRIQQLIAQGHAIGTLNSDFIARADRAATIAVPAAATGSTRRWPELQAHTLEAVAHFDLPQLEQRVQAMLAVHPVDLVFTQVLMPALATLGDRWTQAPAAVVAQEHFLSSYLHIKIGARLHHQHLVTSRAHLLLAAMPGERHELGLLLFGLAARARGFGVTVLGSDVPFASLLEASRRLRPSAIVLSGTCVPFDAPGRRGLLRVARSAGVPVVLGGPLSIEHRDALARAGVNPTGSDFESAFGLLERLTRRRRQVRSA